jgi:seryl-tRNA synthetase
MIDLEWIKRDPDAVRSALLKRMDVVDLAPILDLDRQRRELTVGAEAARVRRKELAARIGQARSRGEGSAEAEAAAAAVKEEIRGLEAALAEVEEALHGLLAALPNVPDERVAPGGKENNRVVHTWGSPPRLPEPALDHVEICTRLGLVDYERGTKLGGSGFWLYSGAGAALEWALLDFFCRSHRADGYQFFLPPHVLLEECGYTAGQFPKFRDDVFHLETRGDERRRFLLPTSETAILNVYRDEILDFERLPLKAFAYTPCYRRESGSYRTEERGTIRGHQFDKVEMFQFVAPATWEEALAELRRKAERLVEALGLHYRTSMLAAGDVSASMAMTYDVEVWIPSIGAYKEVSSISWARDYQARRANIRFRRPGRKGTEYVHTLNASGLATSRLLPAIVEQCQQADGSVVVPEPLRPWLGVEVIGPPG